MHRSRISMYSCAAVILFACLPSSLVAQRDRDTPSGESVSLEYVPRDTALMLTIRPTQILNSPIFATYRAALLEGARPGLRQAPNLDTLQSARVCLLMGRNIPSTVVTFTFASTGDRQRYLESLGAIEIAKAFADEEYVATSRGHFLFATGSKSVTMATQESALRRCLLAGKKGATDTSWARQWAAIAGEDATLVVNTSLMRGVGAQTLLRQLESFQDTEQIFDMVYRLSPLWQRSQQLTGFVRLQETIEVVAHSESVNEDEAKLVHASMLTALSAVRLVLSAATDDLTQPNREVPAELVQTLNLADTMLARAKVTRQDSRVELKLASDEAETRKIAKMLAPVAQATQARAGRTRSFNNLKQLALAFHNYHDVYNAFPAAVQIGPRNTPRSWRVTILPFIEQSELYDAYRQDEPWDSPHNIKLLDRMPDLFRCPGDAPRVTNTSYFAIVGPKTIFEEGRKPRFANILDGTSNTLLLVESKSDVPWTKPEDIRFDDKKPLPKFGGWYPGGFCAAIADGSVRFIPDNWDREMLRLSIMANDGQPFQWPD